MMKQRLLRLVSAAALCLGAIAEINAAPPTAILGAFPEETAWLDSQLVYRRWSGSWG